MKLHLDASGLARSTFPNLSFGFGDSSALMVDDSLDWPLWPYPMVDDSLD